MTTCSSVLSAAAGSVGSPFILKQGRNFTLVVTATDADGRRIDLSSPSRTGRGEMRRTVADIGTPVATFSVIIRAQTGSNIGVADVSLGADVSAATAAPLIAPGDYVGDVKFVNDGDATDVIATDVFHIRVVPEVTK